MTDTPPSPPRILAIAGSDSGGGAGIQADIKTITMLGGYAMTAITAVTAQNTVGVQAVETLSADFVKTQIVSCLDDLGVDAIKIGMLGSLDIAHAVAEAIAPLNTPIVFDPVMVATSGSALADEATIAAFETLMELATVATPNLPELAMLTGMLCNDQESISNASQALCDQHGCAVLAKGGHGTGEQLTDRLLDPGGRAASFTDARIDTAHTHGTGCTLSSAIATLLGHGQELEHAVRLGRRFVRKAIIAAPELGAGHGPLGHHAVRKPD